MVKTSMAQYMLVNLLMLIYHYFKHVYTYTLCIYYINIHKIHEVKIVLQKRKMYNSIKFEKY